MARRFASRFAAVDRRIAASIAQTDLARIARDSARTARGYERAEAMLHKARDEHSSAWNERNDICAQWEAHFANTYGAR